MCPPTRGAAPAAVLSRSERGQPPPSERLLVEASGEVIKEPLVFVEMGSRAAPPLEKGIGGGTLSKAVARKGQEAHAVLEVGQGVRFVQRENGERRSQPQEPRVLTPSTAEETTAPLPARPPALLGPPAPRPQPRPPLRPHSRWRRGEAVRGARRK